MQLSIIGRLFLGLACTMSACSSGGSGGSGGTSGSGGAAGLPATFGETACIQCVIGDCSAEIAACDADTACKQLKDCHFACPPKNSHEADDNCTEACGGDSSVLDPLGACYKDAVDAACAVPCD